MNKIFCLLLFSTLSQASSYVSSSWNVYHCFGNVDFKERSPSRRNLVFDLCLERFSHQINSTNCASLADRYYGLSAKNKAMNNCISFASNFNSCIQIADSFMAYPTRMTNAINCLEDFKGTYNERQCRSVAFRYKPLEKRVTELCNEQFSSDEDDQPVHNPDHNSGDDQVDFPQGF